MVNMFKQFDGSEFEWFYFKNGYTWIDKGRIIYPWSVVEEYENGEQIGTHVHPPMNYGHRGERTLTHLGKGSLDFLVEAEGEGFVTYFPFKEGKNRTLFMEFANTDISRDSIKLFANRYGPLTRLSGTGHDGEPYSFWVRNILYMKWAINLWEWICNLDEVMLDKVIIWSNDKQRIGYVLSEKEELDKSRYAFLTVENLKKSIEESGEYPAGIYENEFFESQQFPYFMWGFIASDRINPWIFEKTESGDKLLPAKYLLSNLVNTQLRGRISPRIHIDHGNLLNGELFNDLLASMWYQFFQVVHGERKLKRCKLCGLWEDVTDNRSDWQGHPTCLAAARQKGFRERQRRQRENQ